MIGDGLGQNSESAESQNNETTHEIEAIIKDIINNIIIPKSITNKWKKN